jgi:hypothetical protein
MGPPFHLQATQEASKSYAAFSTTGQRMVYYAYFIALLFLFL